MPARGRKPKRKTGASNRPFSGVDAVGAPPKPAIIADDVDASGEWDRVCQLLTDNQVLSPADLGILVAYCSAYSTVARCRRELAFEPMLVHNSKTGAIKTHPLYNTLSAAEGALARYAGVLGLTPADRGRVEALDNSDAEASKLDKLNAATAKARHSVVRSVPLQG
ncbi:phage terminase small subunit P27 family [Paludisphaera rhizosphaerae]|uniref:phage terminase small subunit P27 family n=1 Tax=Paludisphaera rhizosphaerae TaxID=2711216 RepID=UPI0013EB9D8D|nr:phage terminase small subunit P27 family [Paludisphaera rhizosphaerae]